jgi:hypothetical protein
LTIFLVIQHQASDQNNSGLFSERTSSRERVRP